MRRLLPIALAGTIAMLTAALVAFAWLLLAPRHVPEGQPPLATVAEGDLATFRDAFDAGGPATVRVLAMLSPT